MNKKTLERSQREIKGCIWQSIIPNKIFFSYLKALQLVSFFLLSFLLQGSDAMCSSLMSESTLVSHHWLFLYFYILTQMSLQQRKPLEFAHHNYQPTPYPCLHFTISYFFNLQHLKKKIP
jgi:hypothetical protein